MQASISVVIPTRNDARRLGDALRSITRQTILPDEIVVSDDGSDDDTEAVVAAFVSDQSPVLGVRYVRSPAARGVVAARNAGIAAASGEWIANCDSDDYWDERKLETQLNYLRDWTGSDRLALVATHGYNVSDRGEIISRAIMGPTSELEFHSLRRAGSLIPLLHSSVLFRRADFDAVGGYSDEYGAADDAHFFCKMADRGIVISIPASLTFYRKRAGSIQTARFWQQRHGMLRLAANERRRALGRPPLDAVAFANERAAAPLRARFQWWRQGWGLYHYRAGAVAVANGRRARGAAQLILASALDGARVRAGVANAVRYRAAALRRR